MAQLIASRLRKEIAGDALFDGVSFKVERRDRLALSGPNGAGKTTLLRMLTGETRLDGGELAFEKGTRVALHDQRPPLERGLTLREYVLGGARDLVAAEEDLRRLESAMAEGDHGAETLAAYSAAQARLEHAGGYGWRDHATSVVRGLGFADEDFDRSLRTFSGGELTRASLARALAGDPDLLLLDEPTTGLAPQIVDSLIEQICVIERSGTGVLWVIEEHPSQILPLCGRVFLMDSGQIRHEATGPELLADPGFAEMFLGARVPQG
jgi:ATP-binding cassette subfamily F protein 3